MNEQLGITGKWINKFTGKSIIVRDSIIDGDEMIIISDQGQINMQEFSQNYIQTSDEIYDESGNIVDNVPVSVNEIQLNNKPVYVNETQYDLKPIQINNKEISIESKNPNYDLLDKLFKKKKFIPVININIDSDDFPIEQLKMLMDIYDVTSKDISEYLMKEYIKLDFILKTLSEFIDKKMRE